MRQFSIRDLLFVILIISLALGWWVDRRNSASTSQRFQLQVADEHAFIVDTVTGQSWQQSLSGGYSSPDFLQPKSADE
jgi:hypothetical protein